MFRILSMALISALFLATPLAAQENSGTGLSLGQPASGEPKEGQVYIKDEAGDWLLRCVRRAEGKEPCHLFQRLHEAAGNPIAEIVLFRIPPGQAAVAGANILTPLETLLQRNLTMSVDGAEPKAYPFAFCTRSGCTSRIGLTATELLAFEQGSTATITIHALAAPDRPVEIELSLSGFTAAYDKLLDNL